MRRTIAVEVTDTMNSTRYTSTQHSSTQHSSHELSFRDRAILRAVAGGTVQLVVSAEPDLVVDGRFCSDQVASRRLTNAGLIVAATPAAVGQRVLALLTPAGERGLAAAS
jgi:hypothetical protein